MDPAHLKSIQGTCESMMRCWHGMLKQGKNLNTPDNQRAFLKAQRYLVITSEDDLAIAKAVFGSLEAYYEGLKSTLPQAHPSAAKVPSLFGFT